MQAVNIAQLKRVTKAPETIAIIDTAPGDTRGIDAALNGADLIIIPTASSAIDMSRVWETEAIASEVAAAYILLTQVNTRTRSYAAAFDVLEEQGRSGIFRNGYPSQRKHPSVLRH